LTAFLDACAIIDQVEAVPPFQARLAALLGALRGADPGLALAVSRLSWIECRSKPLQERVPDVLARYDAFLDADGLVVIELTADLIDLATGMRAEYRLKTPDAIQAASALMLGAGTVFVTNDPVFERVRGLDVRLL
jgi:predicted nucleic acid-binding protein